MDELWNNCELGRPPLVTLPVKDARFTKRLYPALHKYLKTGTTAEKDFAETAALLSRLMARRKNSFRNMVGFRSVRKLNSSLCRLLRVDLARDLELFASAVDDEFNAELPSRNCLDFVLVRLLAVYNIHKRIRDCCLEAAEYFVQMVRMTFFLEISTLLLAIFAKLRTLSAVLGNKVLKLYAELRRHRMSFPWKGPLEFIPNGIELPESLDPFPTTAADKRAAPTPSTMQATKITVHMSEQLPASRLGLPKFRTNTEIGTAVQRTAQKSAPNTTAFSLASLTTIEDVKKFIIAENVARKTSPKTCITKGVPQHEWSGAQKLFQRRVAGNERKKALSVFLKFLSSKI